MSYIHSPFASNLQEVKEVKKRTVIVTSFGTHDAWSQVETSRGEGSGSARADALAACRDATARLTRHAATGDFHLAPLVFLLQYNAAESGGVEQMLFLDEVHRVQREEVEFGARNETGIRDTGRATEERDQRVGGDGLTTHGGGGAGGNQLGDGGHESSCDDGDRRGVFLVEDTTSKLRCNRHRPSSHRCAQDAEMLWNLIALVDREQSLSPAIAQATRKEPSRIARARDVDVSGPRLLEADAVWSRLEEAAASRDECSSPPCGEVSTREYNMQTVRTGRQFHSVNRSSGSQGTIFDTFSWNVWHSNFDSPDRHIHAHASPLTTSLNPFYRCQGMHMHDEWDDFGEEMSRVQGAVVVRRPGLTQIPGMLAPANSLDFVQTLQSYFTIFKNSLFPSR